MHIYIAGPLETGDVVGNVHNAVSAANDLLDRGHQPFVPHLNVGWHFAFPQPRERWMQWCLAWVERCDAVLRIGGYSEGADQEVEHATRLKIPVYHSLDAVDDSPAVTPMSLVSQVRTQSALIVELAQRLDDVNRRLCGLEMPETTGTTSCSCNGLGCGACV